MFDEAYSSHQFYQFDKFRSWFKSADAFVFVGTSFAVTVTDLAIREAKKRRVPVFNFNLEAGRLEPTATLNVENVIGKAEETLLQLAEAVRDTKIEEEEEERARARKAARVSTPAPAPPPTPASLEKETEEKPPVPNVKETTTTVPPPPDTVLTARP